MDLWHDSPFEICNEVMSLTRITFHALGNFDNLVIDEDFHDMLRRGYPVETVKFDYNGRPKFGESGLNTHEFV